MTDDRFNATVAGGTVKTEADGWHVLPVDLDAGYPIVARCAKVIEPGRRVLVEKGRITEAGRP